MIKVDVNRNRKGQITRFTLTGHAGSGPHGFDLVCAGVSAVSFGTLNAVEALAGVSFNIRQREGGGFLDCLCPDDLPESRQEKVQLLLEAMLVSLRTIEMSYGQYIKIND